LCEQIKKKSLGWPLDYRVFSAKKPIIQILLVANRNPEWVACVDPIALPKLDDLFEAIYKPVYRKNISLLPQDLEIFIIDRQITCTCF